MTAEEIRPHPGPQWEFLASVADIAIYGGAAGGGKSFALLLEPLYDCENPRFGGVVFRRTSPQLIGAGSLWDGAQELYRPLGARLTGSPSLNVEFRSGATLEFRHLQHVSDVYDHQGKEYAFVGFDELTHFEESQFWYMVSRMRSTSGARVRMRCTTNPDPDSFVRRLIDWWIGSDGLPIFERSGVLRWFIRDGDALIWGATKEELAPKCRAGQAPMSITFIAASLKDNPALTAKDPGYEGRIQALPEVERQRLGGGNWDVRPEGGRYVRMDYFARRWAGCLPWCAESHRHEKLLPPLKIYSASDFAVTEPRPGQNADYTEHGWFGISPTDDLYVLDWWFGQTAADVWIDALLDKCASAKPMCWFGEGGVIRRAIEPFLVKRMRERRIYFRAEWLSTSTGPRLGGSSKQGFEDSSKQAKAVRGRAFQARSAMGKVIFPSSAPWLDHVISQVVGFPNGKDDAFDTISHMCNALDQAHHAIVPAGEKQKPRHDYDRDEHADDGAWRTV